MADADEFRSHFPALNQRVYGQPLIYLDNAATTQKPVAVMDAVRDVYSLTNANVHRGSHYLSAQATTHYENARATVQHFIGAPQAQSIIWTRGATEAINLVAHTWGRTQLCKNDEIILTQMEHHANIVPWQLLQKEIGFTIHVVPLTSDYTLDTAQFDSLLNANTKLVSVVHTSNALGIINPIHSMIKRAHAVGAKVLIDGAQAIAHQRVNVAEMGCDFFVFSGHKLFAPSGIGVLYATPECLTVMPPYQGGGEMIDTVSFEHTTFQKAPLRFEAGTPNIEGAIGLASAMDFLNTWDNNALFAHEQHLLQTLKTGIEQRGLDKKLKLIGDAPLEHKAPILSFIAHDMHNKDVATALDQHGIAVRTGHHCTMPLMQHLGLDGTVRIAFAPYNTTAEVHTVCDTLASILMGNNTPSGQKTPPTPSKNLEPETNESVFEQLSHIPTRSARYRELLKLGQGLISTPELEVDENRIQGCESAVWVKCDFDEAQQTVHIEANSDANVISGLLALIVDAYDGQNPSTILSTDVFAKFDELKLSQYLSPSRGNGVRAIIAHITDFAEQHK